MLYLKFLEKQEQAKPKTNRREIVEIRVEINEINTKKPYKESIKQRRKQGEVTKQLYVYICIYVNIKMIN
jgi:hypothetical protein